MEKKIKVVIGEFHNFGEEKEGLRQIVVGDDMLPDVLIRTIRRSIKDFYKNENLNALEIYTNSILVIRELSNMVIAHGIADESRIAHLTSKGFSVEDAKYYYIDVKYLKVITTYDDCDVRVSPELGIYIPAFEDSHHAQKELGDELLRLIFGERSSEVNI